MKRKIHTAWCRCKGCKADGAALRQAQGRRGGCDLWREGHAVSDAAGVHPSQVPAEKERLAKMGIRADFTKDGRMIWSGPKQKKEVIRSIEPFLG